MVLNPSGSRFCTQQVLIDRLIAEGWLKTPTIISAFWKIKRTDFLPGELSGLAEINEALPIGNGQTISQPLTVAFMLELLQPGPGNKILDVGSGSGWTSALLAYIVSEEELNSKRKAQSAKRNGKVIAIELIPKLKEFGEKNAEKYGFVSKKIVQFVCADGSKGYPEEAPFDKILASASAEEVPPALKEQLKIGGRLVIPIESSIWLFVKKSETEFEEKEYPGFVFVPLVSKPST
ncbi:MAG: protein-L-isoaspartate O-methyltransferase [Candidatus Nealsonbacteria bacterium CG08_land_8_20_14_0_20_43_11]|uniref:Protein-L-isoaspartate O-methyltransferase n=1 Tax=Candidatus Nealsonbacteria bacterium CG08_land_8_20_14_0_20_43_11 TaxID=1974706 RepID=A0A2M6T1C8_9BACT|nr:MAG: protein-L-isoaspartate O-methyltransferase [Candidatus Nealsonbacteria bacterium CG08_land_8_20_14_0_20_43_11]